MPNAKTIYYEFLACFSYELPVVLQLKIKIALESLQQALPKRKSISEWLTFTEDNFELDKKKKEEIQ